MDGGQSDHKLPTIAIMHTEVALLCATIQGQDLCKIHLRQ